MMHKKGQFPNCLSSLINLISCVFLYLPSRNLFNENISQENEVSNRTRIYTGSSDIFF